MLAPVFGDLFSTAETGRPTGGDEPPPYRER
jgi:hypothetical protein